MRGLAYFHLPFASLDETVFRLASSYLLQRYYRSKRDGTLLDDNFEDLKAYFREVQTVNYHFLDRIREGCKEDSNLNVLATLFTISSMISLALERHLKEIEHLFVPPSEGGHPVRSAVSE